MLCACLKVDRELELKSGGISVFPISDVGGFFHNSDISNYFYTSKITLSVATAHQGNFSYCNFEYFMQVQFGACFNKNSNIL